LVGNRNEVEVDSSPAPAINPLLPNQNDLEAIRQFYEEEESWTNGRRHKSFQRKLAEMLPTTILEKEKGNFPRQDLSIWKKQGPFHFFQMCPPPVVNISIVIPTT